MYHASSSSSHNYQHSRPSMQLPLPAPLSLSIQSPRSQNYPPYMSQTNPASPPVQTPGQASNPPPDESPTAVVEVNDDANYNIPTPPPICKRWQGMLWKIEVIQNPLRARMCGFGDKVFKFAWIVDSELYTSLTSCRIVARSHLRQLYCSQYGTQTLVRK